MMGATQASPEQDNAKAEVNNIEWHAKGKAEVRDRHEKTKEGEHGRARNRMEGKRESNGVGARCGDVEPKQWGFNTKNKSIDTVIQGNEHMRVESNDMEGSNGFYAQLGDLTPKQREFNTKNKCVEAIMQGATEGNEHARVESKEMEDCNGTNGDREDFVEGIMDAENTIPEINICDFNPEQLNGHASEAERDNLQESVGIGNTTAETKGKESDGGLLKVAEYGPQDAPKRKLTLGDLDEGERVTDRTDEVRKTTDESQQNKNQNKESKQNERSGEAKQEEEKDEVERETENQNKYDPSDVSRRQDVKNKLNQTGNNENGEGTLKENGVGTQKAGNQTCSGYSHENQKPEENEAGTLKENGIVKQKTRNQTYSGNSTDENQKPENQSHNENGKIQNQNGKEKPETLNHNENTIDYKPNQTKTTTTTTTTTTSTSTRTKDEERTERHKHQEEENNNNETASENHLGLDFETLKRLLPHMSPVLLPRALQALSDPLNTKYKATNTAMLRPGTDVPPCPPPATPLDENTINSKPNQTKATTTATRTKDEERKGRHKHQDEDDDDEENKNNNTAPENRLGLDYETLQRLVPHMSPALLPKASQAQNDPRNTKYKATNTAGVDGRQSCKNSLDKIQESLEGETGEGSEDEPGEGSDDDTPATPPPHFAFASLRRHSFHHFPAPPPQSSSEKAEKMRAILQAMEEEELSKISKGLGNKIDLVRQHLGHVENRLFEMFGDKEKQTININKFLMGLTATGMRPTDPRLKQTRDNLKKLQDNLGTEFVTLEVDYDTFMSIISENLEVVVRAFSGSFVIPDFQGFCKQIEDIYTLCHANHSGRPAHYIPQLARFSSKCWGVSVCTVDGQRFSLGDVDVPFTIQSCSKPLTYAIGLALNGTEYVHKYVGMEPSGRYFNELVLDYNNKPHNPMINSGAIMTSAIIKPELSAADRFDYMFKVYKRLAGDEYLGFNNSVFLSEKECSDRNFALAYFMRENKCFPPNHKLHESLDFYFQLCSMEITAESGAVMAATLANGGLNPLTGDPVLTVDAIRNTLTLMHSCGMYNYSGQFAFQVGLPAKSGVSGCVLLVVPNTMGICLWSPPLDSNGNSCRGVQFCMEMVSRFNFHNFDNLRGYSKSKQDPRTTKAESKAQILFDLLFSAAAGDISALRRHSLAGTDMQAKDYDGRTALHVATSEGHDEVVDFLVNRCNVFPLPKDRWDRTPLDDAESFDRPVCLRIIKECCKRKNIELPISYKDFMALNNQTSGMLVAPQST
ncbi:uncharacterized protein LOC126998206 isoform X1 [Eriocheir sinensis]|uniref:uncharacterized protein LOC126998206 isoform X1 n=1 Tax=Eriocheir sinensis TaxID=95602 RepID=UPI0021CA7B03|nr:uncharacterized protein LOC126998206 isoform X1 [Eriocheir sinensis]